jgi:hypothetical protein
MVDFGGWDMPVPLRLADDEHHAVRCRRRHVRRLAHAGRRCSRLPAARDFLRFALATTSNKLKTPGKALVFVPAARRRRSARRPIGYYLRDDFFRPRSVQRRGPPTRTSRG